MKRIHKKTIYNTYPIISLMQPTSPAAEAYRRLKVSIEYLSIDESKQVIQISSALKGEGKTTVALNIAAICAEEKKVLILDLDLRKPKIHRAFKLENSVGITDYLSGKAKKEEIIKNVSKNMDIVVRGEKVAYPVTVLSSNKLADFIQEMRKEYDYIIIDCPPVLMVADPILISSLSDGLLFVVSCSETKKNHAKEAMSLFKKNNVNVLGTVMTDIDLGKDAYYRYNYN